MDLNLDLDNFENPEAEGSRYVLTSPRSLEACARMKVRPVQLLPKALDEFIEENPKKPLPLLQVFYDNHELKRTELLQKCREIRKTIIMEEKVANRKEPSMIRSQTMPRKNFSRTKEKLTISKSVGAKISQDENNNSADAVYEIIPESSPRNPKKPARQSTLVSRKFGQNLTPGPAATFTKSKSKSESKLHEEPYMISTPIIPTKFSSNRSLNKSENRGTLTRRSLAERNFTDRYRSRSLDCSKRKPRKNPDIELASSLKFANTSQLRSGYSTPQQQKDQKIVEVLKEKRKKQENEARRISEKQREWEEERMKEENKKQQEFQAKERSLHQAQLEWEKRMKEREEKRVRELRQAEMEKQMILEETEKEIERKKKTQERVQRALMDERRKAELLRKQQQTAAKISAEHEIQVFQESTEREIDMKLDKAQKYKLEAELKEINKLQFLNKSQRERFLKLEKEIKKKQTENEEKKKTQIQEKMEKADILRIQKITEREQALKHQAKEEELRKRRAKEKHEISNRKNEEHLQTIAEQKKELLQRANTTQMQNILTKSKRAQQLRETSQEEQKKRLKEIEMEEEKHLEETKEFLEAKDYRSKTLQQLKETAIRLSRANARASEAARSEVKQKDDTFLEAHKHAALISSIGRGPRTGQVNASTVKFG